MRNKRFNTVEEAVEAIKDKAKRLGFNVEEIAVEPLKQNDGAWIFVPYRSHKGKGCFTVLPHSKKDNRYSIRCGKYSC